MKYVTRAILMTLALVAASGATLAQRASTVNEPAGTQDDRSVLAPAPQTVKAKYEGGIVGYKKSDGSLRFDDENKRLWFSDKNDKKLFSVPYEAVMVAHADTKAQRPRSAEVIGSLPLPYGANIPAWFIKKKHRYLVLQYRDPDTNAEGIANFKLENKEILASVLNTLATKAGLMQRGDAFIRRRPGAPDSSLRTTLPTPPPNQP